jgi:GWxTD domain-containing protein
MNIVKSYILMTVFFILVSLLVAEDTRRMPTLMETLNISRERQFFAKAEQVRFLTEEGHTEFHINFKIPNNELQFISGANGFMCNLDVSFNIYHDNRLVSPFRYSHLAGARTVGIAQSENHFVLDKISFTLQNAGYSAILEITDKNAGTIFRQSFDFELLEESSLLSDIEISRAVSTNLIDPLKNFTRGQFQFYVDPIPVLDGNERDFIAFHTVSNIEINDADKYSFFQYITIYRGDEIVWQDEFFRNVDYLPYPVINRIPLGDYSPGLYRIQIRVVCPKGESEQTVERMFSVRRNYIMLTQRVFADDDEEFALISFFLDNRMKRHWRDLNEQGKKGFIERFWVANNPHPTSEENLFLTTIRQRVNEANWRYTHHRLGWRSDMGRIFIKHGAPDSIDRRETDADISVRFSRRPIQIWRYHGSDRTYMFLDTMGNGNFQLIFSKNDDTEYTDPMWRTYFGHEFDFSTLNL